MARSRMADQVGRVLGGRYRLVAPIGMGASAHVYAADDAKLRRRVAVKILHAALAGDESFLRRFRAEARSAAAMRHPHIMSVFDWGEDDDGPFLVLEYLGGGSLRDLLDAGHLLSAGQVAQVGTEAARALDYAHRRGLVHRDIKPANLLFDEEGRLCIADFGLARALAEAAWTEPADLVIGTARYASPEQASGASLDPKADVYSLALVLVEALTGYAPFAADTTIATLMARRDRPIAPPPEAEALGDAIAAAGAVDPAERIDAATFARLLEESARKVSPPAPLPLTRDRIVDLETVADLDPTQLPASPRNDDTVALKPIARPARVTTDDATTTRVFDRAAVTDFDDGLRRSRLKRVLFGVLVAVVAAAGIAGGAYAYQQYSIPSHPVPQLNELTEPQARAEVRDEKFRIRVERRSFSEAVPVGQIVNQEPSAGSELKEGKTITIVLSKGAEPRDVPNLANLNEAEAIAAVEKLGLVPKVEHVFHEEIAKGTVIGWEPVEGQLPKGAELKVVISDGPEARSIPDVRGKAFDEAKAALEALGLTVSQTEDFSDEVNAGLVAGTRPPAGEKAEKGSEVVVVISKGPQMVTVPDVTNMAVDDAEDELRKVGLRVAGVQGSPRRGVRRTDPPAGREVKVGSEVTLITE